MTLLLVLTLLLAVAMPPVRPDARLTPGDVATTDLATVCKPGYASSVRNVSEATKRAVYAAYGIKPSGHWVIARSGKRTYQSDYEIDHLVSLQLGGRNTEEGVSPTVNLWPQHKYSKPYNALMKDDLEGAAHRAVCAGTMELTYAQKRIATDWIAFYHEMGLSPHHAKP